MKRAPTILILEDEALIALDVEKTLKGVGGEQIVSLSRRRAAESWLTDNTPDVAILDIRLRDGDCGEIAAILAERHVPFIIHTAHCRMGEAERFPGKWVAKPSEPEILRRAVTDCIQQRPMHARCEPASDRWAFSEFSHGRKCEPVF
jgi:two-component SAPR family response regulator